MMANPAPPPTTFILASQSPRRRELFALLGYPYESLAPDVDEDVHLAAEPATYVRLTARQKAEAIANSLPAGRRLIVAADTTVALDGAIMGKPVDDDEAWSMLAALRGRDHQVHTGLCVLDPTTGREFATVATADVTMRDYNDVEIAAYIATGDPFDKAGAYAIQHPIFRPVVAVAGCYPAVMGLPLCDLIPLFRRLGLPDRFDPAALAAAHGSFIHACPSSSVWYNV